MRPLEKFGTRAQRPPNNKLVAACTAQWGVWLDVNGLAGMGWLLLVDVILATVEEWIQM